MAVIVATVAAADAPGRGEQSRGVVRENVRGKKTAEGRKLDGGHVSLFPFPAISRLW